MRKPAATENDSLRTQRLAEDKARREALQSVSALRPRFEIKSFRSFQGMECMGYSGTLYVDGVKAAGIHNEGSGGPTVMDWTVGQGGTRNGGPHYEKVARYAAAVPAYPFYGKMLTTDIELLIGELFEEEAERRKITRLCAHSVPVRSDAQLEGEWLVTPGPYTLAARDGLARKLGPSAVFAHELYLGVQPMQLPIDAESWLPRVQKGYMVFQAKATGGRWVWFKNVKDTPAERARVAQTYPGVVFLNDLYAAEKSRVEAQAAADKKTAKRGKAA